MNANRTISGPVFAGMLAAWLAFGASVAQADNGKRPSPEQLALAHSTCVNIMHIREGFVPFDACIESLSEILADQGSGRMVSRGTSTNYTMDRPGERSYSQSNIEERRRKEEYSCARLGMLPGSAGFGMCVVQLDMALRSVERSD
jgi:hypothetical protein